MVYNTGTWHEVGGTEVSLQRKPLFFGKNPRYVQQLIAGQNQLKGVFDKTLHLGEDGVKSLSSSIINGVLMHQPGAVLSFLLRY